MAGFGVTGVEAARYAAAFQDAAAQFDFDLSLAGAGEEATTMGAAPTTPPWRSQNRELHAHKRRKLDSLAHQEQQQHQPRLDIDWELHQARLAWAQEQTEQHQRQPDQPHLQEQHPHGQQLLRPEVDSWEQECDGSEDLGVYVVTTTT